MLQSHLFNETVQLAADQRLLVLNSAADPFVPIAARRLTRGRIVLAEDNVAALQHARASFHGAALQHVPFHECMLQTSAETLDVALMNLLYQPAKAWMLYGLEAARYALKPGGRLYVVGARDRGIVSLAKRMQDAFGNAETLAISKGWRVVSALKTPQTPAGEPQGLPLREIFAGGALDEGTRLLLEHLEVRATDVALDLGSGAGYIGLHIARLARKGSVTLLDASLAAVAMARQEIERSGLQNVQALPSDGAQAVLAQRFDLVATNPPFHLGGMQTTEVAERFIREAAQVLMPRGRFYLVANRFLKYEPALRECFESVTEVGGDKRYKVLRALQPIRR